MDFRENLSPQTRELARILFQFQRLNPPRQRLSGIRRSEFFFLAVLAQHLEPGVPGIRASEVSSLMEITPGAVTHILNILEKNGYAERTSDPSDRRIVLVRPTEGGLAVLNQAYSQMMETLDGLIDFLGENDSQEFIRLFSLALGYFRQKSAE